MNSLPVRMTGTKKGKNKRSGNSAVELVSRSQWNLALNPPSIYFDKPKSKEKSDDEGNYKKSKSQLILRTRALIRSKGRFAFLEVLTRHLKRGCSGV